MVDRICDNCMSRVPAGTDKCPKCGIRFENTNPGGALPNGWVLGGRYTVGRYIDIDGEGVSYSAIDGDNLQRVIIKEFMPVTLCATRDETGAIQPKPGCEVLFKTTRMDYAELYSILLRMGLVEGLVQVLDVLEENNTAYAVIEKIEGPTLAEYLTRTEGPLDPERALAMLRPVLIGVDAMHSASIIHRGISPENIILESGGVARLSGYATLALRQQGSELKPKLYPGYSAPEQYAASEFEGRYTDVYALGAVLYRMVTDESPLPADERRLQDNMRNAKAEYKEVPAYLSAAIARAMRIVPAERIQNIPDLRLALTGEGGRTARGPMGLTKKQMIIGGTVLGIIIVAIIVILLVSIFGGGRPGPASSSSSSSTSQAAETVPDFEGKRYDDVVKSSSYKDKYNFGPAQYEYSPDVQEGVIISQSPKGGSPLKDDTVITFVVSKGAEKVTIPEGLVGMPKDQAVQELKGLGLTDDDIVLEPFENNGELVADSVVKTDPAAGGEVSIGKDKVTVYYAADVAVVQMPSIEGWTYEDAAAALDAQNIKYTKNLVDNDGTHTAGTVQSTDPAAGVEVLPGATNVTVNVYDVYRMPDLSKYVGKPAGELYSFLDERSIPRTDGDTVSTSDPKLDGAVAKIDYTVNAPVTDDTLVVIHLYSYTEPEPDPDSQSDARPNNRNRFF